MCVRAPIEVICITLSHFMETATPPWSHLSRKTKSMMHSNFNGSPHHHRALQGSFVPQLSTFLLAQEHMRM
jgi:hypothetical protein